MKIVCGLGNPGVEYQDTRHNVGWWLLEHARRAWDFPGFRREGPARVTSGRLGAEPVRLLEPLTYMNRSGRALAPLRARPDFDIARDLLVVVDDVALEVGRARLRVGGSAGGHNGLKSVEAALATREYPRLRIGVGACPPGADLAEWVLSPVPAEDRELILSRLSELVDGVRLWIEEGAGPAMRLVNP